jgi:CBS domain containing-hemolysin-like protein
MSALHLFGVLFLVGVNAFFSATEFSLVAVRDSRVRQLIEKGDPRAKIVGELIADLNRVVSGVQVGITICSLLLGYLGEATLATVLMPMASSFHSRVAALVAHTIALAIAFGLLTVLQVVLGELVPKSLSLARAERVALLVARPFHWFLRTFRWAIDLLDNTAETLTLALGITSHQSHTMLRSSEELQVMLQQARDRGFMPEAEVEFIQNAMELNQIQVREIMVPRPDMHALPVDATLDETMKLFAATQRSRVPVYDGSLDHILGFVHMKDVVWVLLDLARATSDDGVTPEFHLKNMLREALIVPETKPASELLVEFRAKRVGLAMIVDEFGSILGLITLEDILEQMVGEIHDEFDVVEGPHVLPEGELLFDGAIAVRELETQYNIALPEDQAYETLGGFILNRLGFIPRGGESFEAEGYRFTVMEMDHRRVARVKIKPLPPPGSQQPPAAPGEPATAAPNANEARQARRSRTREPSKI